MIIRTVSFDPLRVEYDNQEVDVSTAHYKDQDGVIQSYSYIEVNGEKYVIQKKSEVKDSDIKEGKIDVVTTDISLASKYSNQKVKPLDQEKINSIWDKIEQNSELIKQS